MNLEVTYQNAFQKLKRELGESEARSVINHIFRELGYPIATILSQGNTELSGEIFDRITKTVDEILSGRPVQYVLGYTWFYDFKIRVNPKVLIPRPETEELAHLIISENKEREKSILDLATGSGCLAIALAGKIPGASVTAVDISDEALQLAAQNARENGVNVDFLRMDLLGHPALNRDFDLIVSNPPYVRNMEKAGMKANVLLHEPHLALFVPDTDPLIFYKAIAKLAKQKLRSGGRIYLEVNESLAEETAGLFTDNIYHKVWILKDMQNKNRFIKVEKR